MSDLVDLYAMLGVAPDADINAIRQAIALHHNAGTVEPHYIEAAKNVLLNAAAREKYDAKLQQQAQAVLDAEQALARKKADELTRYQALKAAQRQKKGEFDSNNLSGKHILIVCGMLALVAVFIAGLGMLNNKPRAQKTVNYPYAENSSASNNDVFILRCQELAKTHLQYPETFKSQYEQGDGVMRLSDTERTAIITFTGTNAFNVPERFKGVCAHNGQKVFLISVTKK